VDGARRLNAGKDDLGRHDRPFVRCDSANLRELGASEKAPRLPLAFG
jgi:hypothetical protein